MFRRFILWAVLGLSFPAQAQEPARQFQGFTYPGNDSCASWSEYRKGNRAPQLEGWVLGFVTAYNMFGSGNRLAGADTNAKGLLAWVDQYCATNPLDTVMTASSKLVIELKNRQR